MTNSKGNNKVKFIEAENVKDAEAKANNKYSSFEIGRITSDQSQIDYYMKVKGGG
jgi:hypothetical protein